MTRLSSELRALILAAGRGRRLEGVHGGPKAMLEFGGRTLIARHLDALRRAGVDDITIVTGFEADRLAAHVGSIRPDAALACNPSYERGSIVSLARGGDVLRAGAPVLLMDADVLFEFEILRRLVATTHADAILVDREFEPGDEPVKLCVDRGRIVDFAKRPSEPHEWHGESVGFFRLSPATAAALAVRADEAVAAGALDLEYESPLRDMIRDGSAAFGFEEVTGLAWTEIDFPSDITKAASLMGRLGPDGSVPDGSGPDGSGRDGQGPDFRGARDAPAGGRD